MRRNLQEQEGGMGRAINLQADSSRRELMARRLDAEGRRVLSPDDRVQSGYQTVSFEPCVDPTRSFGENPLSPMRAIRLPRSDRHAILPDDTADLEVHAATEPEDVVSLDGVRCHLPHATQQEIRDGQEALTSYAGTLAELRQ